MSGSGSRLNRLLAMVPWLLANPGVPVGEAARRFGVSERQVRDDLALVWMCGLPGHTPGDLIDVEYTGDRVVVSNADTIARPLRLSAQEALALVVALRSLAEVDPGDAVERALAKVERAAGDAAEASAAVTVAVEPETEVLRTAQTALDGHRRLRLRYYVPGRDESTDRDVDPIRLVLAGGRSYLEGWCRRAEGVRLFRLDRVLAAEVLDLPAEVPEDAHPRDLAAGLFQAAPDDPLVRLRLAPAARWVAEYYPCEAVDEDADGWLEVALRIADLGFAGRLVLSLGPAAEVLDPPDLAAGVRAAAAAALAGYAE